MHCRQQPARPQSLRMLKTRAAKVSAFPATLGQLHCYFAQDGWQEGLRLSGKSATIGSTESGHIVNNGCEAVWQGQLVQQRWNYISLFPLNLSATHHLK